MKEPNVWVVWGAHGQYSDRVEWVAGAFSSRSLAESWIAHAYKIMGEAYRAKNPAYPWSPLSESLRAELVSRVGDPAATLEDKYEIEELTIDALAVYLDHGSPGVA